MMLFHLLKKDFLIVKKYVLIMMAAAIVIPVFMLWRAPEYKGTLGFAISVIFAVFMLLQYVSLKEYQFPGAAALLCAAPFSRKMMVLSKYVFCITIYALCCVIYGIETVVVPGLGTLDIRLFIILFFVTSVFIGVYLPLQYKLGYDRTKFVFTVVIMASPFILPQLLKMESLRFCFFFGYSPALVCGAGVLAGFGILAVSVFLSVKFYENTDLA